MNNESEAQEEGQEPLSEKVGTYTIHKFVPTSKMQRDADIRGLDLNEALISQAGLAAFYGSQAARAYRQAAMLKLNVDAVIAKVDAEIRQAALSESAKITEKAIEAKIDADNRVLTARKALIIAQQIEKELEAMCFAMAQRRDSLDQLGANIRQELKGTQRILGATAARSNALQEKLANA
jgi:hypothetical protein